MKKALFFALVLAVAYCLTSCEKDPTPNHDGPGGGPSNNADQITFGNYEGMEAFTIDSIVWEYENFYDEHITYNSYLSIEENCGFSLQTHLSRNPIACLSTDPLNYFEISIYTDDIEFHFNMVSSEAYLHIDSTIVQTDSITSIYIDGIYSCGQISESDQFQPDYSYTNKVLGQHNKNEVLSKDDDFMTSPSWNPNIIMYTSNAVFPTQVALDTTNRIVFDAYAFSGDYWFNLPLDVEFYIGFKRTDENGERLGWIKFIIEANGSGHYLAKPLEIAIQKQA